MLLYTYFLLFEMFFCLQCRRWLRSLLSAQTGFACLHDFEHAIVYIVLCGVLPETDSTSSQSHVSLHAHSTQRGADFAAVTRSPDRESHFIFERELYLVTDCSRERDTDDLEGVRWLRRVKLTLRKDDAEKYIQVGTVRVFGRRNMGE
jgi:hypothetical protein